VWQIDNVAYAVGLSERVRTRIEEFGRVELRDMEAAALVRSKAVHMVLIVVTVLVMVWSFEAILRSFEAAFFAFWLGNVAEVVTTPGAGALEKIKGVGKATAAAVLGVVSFLILFMVAAVF
jgi:hypothetical protein